MIKNLAVCNLIMTCRLSYMSNMLPVHCSRKSYAIFYEQDSIMDEDTLLQLCQCFQLFSLHGHRVRGTHRGLVRYVADVSSPEVKL
jgi:hypothetical protein